MNMSDHEHAQPLSERIYDALRPLLNELDELQDFLELADGVGHDMRKRAEQRYSEIVKLRAELKTERDKNQQLIDSLIKIHNYVDQTYSDLIGNLGAEWLAARMADEILPITRAAGIR